MTFHKLPALNAKKIIRALEHAGFMKHRQKGSHLVMIHKQKRLTTIIPIHSGETITKPLLKEILNQCGLPIDDFLDLL